MFNYFFIYVRHIIISLFITILLLIRHIFLFCDLLIFNIAFIYLNIFKNFIIPINLTKNSSWSFFDKHRFFDFSNLWDRNKLFVFLTFYSLTDFLYSLFWYCWNWFLHFLFYSLVLYILFINLVWLLYCFIVNLFNSIDVEVRFNVRPI